MLLLFCHPSGDLNREYYILYIICSCMCFVNCHIFSGRVVHEYPRNLDSSCFVIKHQNFTFMRFITCFLK